MGSVSRLGAGRRTDFAQPGARPSAFQVLIETGDPATDAALGVVSVRVRVLGGRLPVRLHLYVNGDLAEAWSESEAMFDLSLDEYGPGRHAVTARAVDALGRWSGASLIVAFIDTAARPED
jgi:hypothetical protein